MITVTLTKSEVDSVLEGLSPYAVCRNGCVMESGPEDCFERDSSGMYKCKLLRNWESVRSKIASGQ